MLQAPTVKAVELAVGLVVMLTIMMVHLINLLSELVVEEVEYSLVLAALAVFQLPVTGIGLLGQVAQLVVQVVTELCILQTSVISPKPQAAAVVGVHLVV